MLEMEVFSLKKVKDIAFWIAIGLFIINIILIYTLLFRVRYRLNLATELEYTNGIIGYIFSFISIIFISITVILIFNKNIQVKQTGAVFGIFTSCAIVLLSWMFVTWIFWFGYVISSIFLLITCILIMKLNRESA